MTHRKYKFRDRAEAEANYQAEHDQRLRSEWFLSAVLTGTVQRVGSARRYGTTYTAFAFATRHRYFVAVQCGDSGQHVVEGVYDIHSAGQELQCIIAGLDRVTDLGSSVSDHEALLDLYRRALDEAMTLWLTDVAGIQQETERLANLAVR